MLSAAVVSVSSHLLPNVIARDTFQEELHVAFLGILRIHGCFLRMNERTLPVVLLARMLRVIFPGLKRARQPFPKMKDVSLSPFFDHANQCLCLIGGRRAGGEGPVGAIV